MELKNIDHKKYIATVPPLKELEKTYDLIHKHKIFKETRKESMYLDPGADTVKKLKKLQIQRSRNCIKQHWFSVVYAWNFYWIKF